MMKPRLFLVTESPAPSGMGEHMLTLARSLADRYEVVVGAPRGTGLIERARAEGFPVKAVDPGDPGDIERWLRRSRPDVVHVHAGIGWEGHATGHAARAAGARVIRTEHLPYLLTDDGQRQAHRDALEAVDRLIAVSEAVAQSHRTEGLGNRLVTIANGVAPRAARRGRDALRREWVLDRGPVLLMAGRFAPQKGHDLILDALPTVLETEARATLLIAGDGPLLWDVARDVARRGLAGSVRLLGHRRDLPELMAAADLLVMPSRFEGLPLVALEAMASGLPIVASDAPGNAEMLEHGQSGWLSPAGDAVAFGRTIVAALADRRRLASVAGAASERQARFYTAARMVAETGAVYDEEAAQVPERTGDRVTRIGFIGAGGIANRHFGVLEHFGDVDIVGIADVDPGRAEEAATRFGARAFSDYGAMLDECAPDAVYICVPPFAHGGPERACLAAGIPFFVEKPVALDLDTAEAVAKAVAETGLVTAVGYHWRYLETVDEVRGLLRSNPARLMSGYWLDSTPPPQWWWRADQSGGQMVEQTTHLLDLARFLGGEVAQVYGMADHTARPEFPGLDVPTVSTASLRFASGAVANFASTCLLGWNHRVALHLFGDRMAIELTDRDLMVDVGRGRPVRGNNGDPVWHEDRDFIDAVQGKENRIRCPYAEAVATHRLALAVVESARTGVAIRMDAPVKELAHV